MMKHAKPVMVLLLAVGSFGVVGCDDNDVGVVRENWTIDGKVDPTACAAVGAAQMRMVAVDGAGVVQGTEFASCTDFQTTMRLNPGIYDVVATFLGADGAAVSRSLVVSGFGVADDEETILRFDFPLAAFPGR